MIDFGLDSLCLPNSCVGYLRPTFLSQWVYDAWGALVFTDFPGYMASVCLRARSKTLFLDFGIWLVRTCS